MHDIHEVDVSRRTFGCAYQMTTESGRHYLVVCTHSRVVYALSDNREGLQYGTNRCLLSHCGGKSAPIIRIGKELTFCAHGSGGAWRVTTSRVRSIEQVEPVALCGIQYPGYSSSTMVIELPPCHLLYPITEQSWHPDYPHLQSQLVG